MKSAALFELTCPCEDNMENWYSQKLSTYTPHSNTIEKNGWAVDLFAIEVGAQGYSSKSLPICLKEMAQSKIQKYYIYLKMFFVKKQFQQTIY